MSNEPMEYGSAIQGGKVHFLKRVKTGDYEHEEAYAELSFGVTDGYDHRYIFDKAASEARDKVRVMLGQLANEKRPVGHPPHMARPVAVAAAQAPKVDTAPLSVAPPPPPVEPAQDEPAPSRAVVRTSDPAAVDGLDAVIGLAGVTANADPTDMDWDNVQQEIKPITDKQLTDACSAQVAARKAAGYAVAPAIRNCIAKYAVSPGQLRNIPQELRQKFLDEVVTLQGAKL